MGPPPKSAAAAVLLPLLFLGVGHLYLGNVATGLILIAWKFVPTLLFVVPIIWFLPLGAAILTAGVSAGNKRHVAPR